MGVGSQTSIQLGPPKGHKRRSSAMRRTPGSFSRELINPSELQAALGCSKALYQELLAQGLPHLVLSRGNQRARRRFHLPDVIAWLERRNNGQRRRGRPQRRESPLA